MKITAVLPSRGRPLNLQAVLMAFYRLRSTAHDLDFIVGMDEDDAPSHDAVKLIGREIPCRSSIAPRPQVLGEVTSRLYRAADPDAVFVLLADRILPLTQNWDEVVANAAEMHPTRVLWWQCAFYSGAGNFAVPPACRASLPAIVSEIFPFWFDDNWIEEIDLLAHGFPRLQLAATYGGERFGKTHNFRDYPFWVEVFAATRSERLEQARRACERLGRPFQRRPEVQAYLEQRDQLWREKAPEIEGVNRTDAPPSESYLLAKRRAEMFIAKKERAA